MSSTKLPGWFAILTVAALVAVGCTTDDSGSVGAEDESATTTATAPELTGTIDLDVEPVAECDPLQERHCSLPFPSDAYTVESGDTNTGRQIAFGPQSVGENKDGVTVDLEAWNDNDGFSPGSPIMVHAPGVDLEASGGPRITDLEQSLAEDSATVIVDLDTGDRHPHWAELDAGAESEDQRLLIVRPAVNFEEGHRYAVGFRDLVDGSGEELEPSDLFRAYRDRLESDIAEVEARRDRMEEVFAALEEAGVTRDDLWLAWDFTVASERNLTERMLHIRDDAFDELGDAAPTFEVTEVREPDEGDAEHVDRYVDGTFEVPLYLTGEGEPGSSFNYGDDGLPARNEQNPDFTARFTCTVPNAATAPGAEPARPVIYGHGLLGGRGEVDAGNIREMTDEHGMVYCATDWIGMASEDVANAISILSDISGFPTLADRVQQGILDTLYLGRLMIHDDGFVSDPAFQVDGEPILDTDEVFYDGNSQGAIIGGAATAVAQDWTRAVLGVPGMNYSTLLSRSVDFDQYAQIAREFYPERLPRKLGFAIAQMLWDRAETNGYAHHLTDDPLPDTPEHEVLLHVAFGDHQVSDAAAFVEARTADVPYHEPLLAEGRGEIDYTFGLEPIGSYPHDGSAVIMWDSGVPAPPLANTPPRGEGDPLGPHDPHGDPRNMVTARAQKAAFLAPDGVVIDVCDGRPCAADRD